MDMEWFGGGGVVRIFIKRNQTLSHFVGGKPKAAQNVLKHIFWNF